MISKAILFVSILAINTAVQAAVTEAKVDQLKVFANGRISVDFDKKVCGDDDFAFVAASSVAKDTVLSLATTALLADKTVVVNVGEGCVLESFNVKK